MAWYLIQGFIFISLVISEHYAMCNLIVAIKVFIISKSWVIIYLYILTLTYYFPIQFMFYEGYHDQRLIVHGFYPYVYNKYSLSKNRNDYILKTVPHYFWIKAFKNSLPRKYNIKLYMIYIGQRWLINHTVLTKFMIIITIISFH